MTKESLFIIELFELLMHPQTVYHTVTEHLKATVAVI